MASTTDSDSLGAGSVIPGRDWRTASFSFSNGNCIEVASCPCGAGPGFRKAAVSMSNGNCIEAGNVAGRVLVRDTKQDGQGPVLAFAARSWTAFTDRLKGGAA